MGLINMLDIVHRDSIRSQHAFCSGFEESPRERRSSITTGGSFLDLSQAALRAALDLER